MRLWPTKRRWKQLAIGAAIVVALALIANGFMVWRTESRLQAKIAAIRAAGDPASIADLAPKPIPADQNAAAYLEQLAPRLDEFAKDHVRFLDRTPLGKAYEAGRDRGEPPTPEQINAIRAIVEKYPDLDAGLAAAAACEEYASLADYSVNHQQLAEDLINQRVDRIRTAARFVSWRMEVLTSDSEHDRALSLGTQLLRLARLYDNEPLLINYLVSVAVRGVAAQAIYDALAVGSVSPETYAALDRELLLHDDPRHLVLVMKTEQAYGVSATIDCELMPPTQVNPIWLKLVSWPMKSLFVDSLGVYDEQFELAGRPWHEISFRFDPDGKMRTAGHGALGELLGSSLGATYNANARNLATMRALRIFNALVRYRHDNGREASDLAELDLPREATLDPFSGDPLKLKHTDDGWVIYTVMQNGTDDGGDFTDHQDSGLAPRKWQAPH